MVDESSEFEKKSGDGLGLMMNIEELALGDFIAEIVVKISNTVSMVFVAVHMLMVVQYSGGGEQKNDRNINYFSPSSLGLPPLSTLILLSLNQ